MTPPNESPVLRPEAAALYLGVTPAMLKRWRLEGGGPRFLRLGHRSVAYLRGECDAWLASRLRSSTSDPGPGGRTPPVDGGRAA
jgi:predicted DNA-binding transcriptional regulator AlpA